MDAATDTTPSANDTRTTADTAATTTTAIAGTAGAADASTTVTTATLDGVEARIRIVDAAIAVLSRKSYRQATMKDVADEAGLGIADVQAHFPTWPGLVMATVHHWQNLRTGYLVSVARDEGILVYMRRLVEDNLEQPALARLLIAVLAEAMDPSHPSAPYLQTRYEAYHQIIRTGVEHDIAVGRLPHDLDPVHAAELIVGLWEGLRMQHMLRPQMDMMGAFDRALGMLVRDWGVA